MAVADRIVMTFAAGALAYLAHIRQAPIAFNARDALDTTLIEIMTQYAGRTFDFNAGPSNLAFEPKSFAATAADPIAQPCNRLLIFLDSARVFLAYTRRKFFSAPTYGIAQIQSETYRIALPADAVTGGFLVAGWLPVAVAWIRHARRRRRIALGRCPECDYDLRGLPEPRCPECGTPFDAAHIPARTA